MAHEEAAPTLYGLMAELENGPALVHATERARLEGYRKMDAYSPIPIEELSEALGLPRTRLPLLVLIGGILGGSGGYSSSTGARRLRIHSTSAAARSQLAAFHSGDVRDHRARRRADRFVGMWALNRLPMPYHPVFNVPAFARASRDRFFLMHRDGGSEVRPSRDAEVSREPASGRSVRSCAVTLHAQSARARCNVRCTACTCRAVHVHLSPSFACAACRQDMHDTPRYEPLEASTFFADGRSSRVPVANTVARGQLREDTLLYEGKINDQLADEFPMPVTAAVMARGQERFNVFCAPCHGRTGQGNGMVVQRGFRAPPTFMRSGCATRRSAISST
jgi:hypothetical protein